MKIVLLVSLIFFPFAAISTADTIGNDWHLLSNTKGQTVNVRVIALLDNDVILLENEEGKQFETPLDKISEKDREWFAKWSADWEQRAAIGAKLNTAIGHQVFRDSWRLWDEEAELIAKRLRWNQESKTPYSSSFRKYTAEDYRFLGARPFSVAAYGDDRGLLARISLVYANKGDSFSGAGMGEDHFEKGENATTMKSFEDMLERDADTLSSSISGVLGEGLQQRFGEGNNRRSIIRWDWNHHAFILSQEDEEYVSLMIVSAAEADNKGRLDRISDQEMKVRLAKNVVREENGDVYISNIPMVDQGPKGYCVPATFERAMRYQGVPADMYLLAVAGGTAPGGGTNTQRLFEEVKSQVRRKGRRPDDVRLDPLRLRSVRRYVDDGVPIMWQMCSLRSYNAIANKRTLERKSVTDWSAYAARIEDEAKENEEMMEDVKDSYHVCMIIGYNEETQELAVSDSWGKRYEIRWVHIDEAAAVSNGIGFAIKR